MVYDAPKMIEQRCGISSPARMMVGDRKFIAQRMHKFARQAPLRVDMNPKQTRNKSVVIRNQRNTHGQ